MEKRKITIISTKSNKRTVINSDATTLGELKRDLREAGVDYDGMTFYEGLTKTELKLDESLLPHDVQRMNPTTHEPETTNELAFMLTNTNKKIRSGAMSRSEAYAAIKKNNLQEVCLKRFGKNFTMCKTADLISLVEAATPAPSKPAPAKAEKAEPAKAEPAKVEAQAAPATPSAPANGVDLQARESIRRLVEVLYQNDTIEDHDDVENILAPINDSTASASEGRYEPASGSPYSDDELDAMFANMR